MKKATNKCNRLRASKPINHRTSTKKLTRTKHTKIIPVNSESLVRPTKDSHKKKLTILDRDVAFHNAYTRASVALLGSLLNKAFNPAGNGESRDRGSISKTARKAPREIQ